MSHMKAVISPVHCADPNAPHDPHALSGQVDVGVHPVLFVCFLVVEQ